MGCGEPDDGDECDSGWSIFDDVELCLPGRWDAGEEECYDGQMPVEEDVSKGTLTRNFVGARGIEAIVTTQNSVTNVSYPLYDTHGNMVATLTKNTGGTSWSIGDERSYDVWGSVRSGATTGRPKGRYVANLGHVQDDESGLVYMRARYYEPGSGRFLSEDPATVGENWYAYCFNNPASYVDADGQDPIRDLIIAHLGAKILDKIIGELTDFGIRSVGRLLQALGDFLINGGRNDIAEAAATFTISRGTGSLGQSIIGGGRAIGLGIGGASKVALGIMLKYIGNFVMWYDGLDVEKVIKWFK
jgi:RHS repeat-associated protein